MNINDLDDIMINMKQLDIKNNQRRLTYCGIGTNKVKRRLNSLSKTNSIARLYRVALEIEDTNTLAKEVISTYRDKIYYKKFMLINELITLCKECGVIFGRQKSDILVTNSIVYFEIPNCEIIRFHTDIDDVENIPLYNKSDQFIKKSTFDKIERAIIKSFPNIKSKFFKRSK